MISAVFYSCGNLRVGDELRVTRGMKATGPEIQPCGPLLGRPALLSVSCLLRFNQVAYRVNSQRSFLVFMHAAHSLSSLLCTYCVSEECSGIARSEDFTL